MKYSLAVTWTICGACGRRREMLVEALELSRSLQCPGCGSVVGVDGYQLSRLLNANDRTPPLTVTLTPAVPADLEVSRIG